MANKKPETIEVDVKDLDRYLDKLMKIHDIEEENKRLRQRVKELEKALAAKEGK